MQSTHHVETLKRVMHKYRRHYYNVVCVQIKCNVNNVDWRDDPTKQNSWFHCK